MSHETAVLLSPKQSKKKRLFSARPLTEADFYATHSFVPPTAHSSEFLGGMGSPKQSVANVHDKISRRRKSMQEVHDVS